MTCSEQREPKGSASSSTDGCQHPDPYCYASSGSGEEWTRYFLCTECKKKWETVERRSVPVEAEPPLTPEEEEESPSDRCTCGETACESELCDCDFAPCPVDHAREASEPPPPQPIRRPPYAVAYSVQGHLYEVALSGDATVRAVDGALVIQHALGPVAGIVQVLPVINEESP